MNNEIIKDMLEEEDILYKNYLEYIQHKKVDIMDYRSFVMFYWFYKMHNEFVEIKKIVQNRERS
jgi:hypothetical protein